MTRVGAMVEAERHFDDATAGIVAELDVTVAWHQATPVERRRFLKDATSR